MRDPKVIKAARIDTLWGLANLMAEAVRTADRFAASALVLSGARDEIVTDASINALLARLRLPERRTAPGFATTTAITCCCAISRPRPYGDLAQWIDARIAAATAAAPLP